MPEQHTVRINGVNELVPEGAVAWQHNSPIDEAHWIYDESEAARIEREDPSLIVWVHDHDPEQTITRWQVALVLNIQADNTEHARGVADAYGEMLERSVDGIFVQSAVQGAAGTPEDHMALGEVGS